MCDYVSVIAFRHSQEEEENININNTKVSALSKSWRQMVYIDLLSKAFITSRQYPSENLSSTKIVRNTIEKMLANAYELPHKWKTREIASTPAFSNFVFNNDDGRKYPLHYNDLLNGFKGTIVCNSELDNANNIYMQIGSFPTCPICGECSLDDAEHPFCNECDDNIFCS